MGVLERFVSNVLGVLQKTLRYVLCFRCIDYSGCNKLTFYLFDLYPQVKRNQLDQHLMGATQSHLELACRKISKQNKKIHNQNEDMENIKAEMQNIEAELESVKAHQYSNVCVSKISNFEQSLQEVKDGVRERIVSDQFYTAPQGYRLGESDAILPWPCTKKVIFTVIDQQENVVDRENISKSMILPKEDPTVSGRPTCSNDGCGFDLASHKKLGTRKYVVDDTLFLRVEISD